MDEGFTIPTKDVHTCLEQARLFIRSLGGDRQDLQEVHATFADWVVELLSKSLMTLSLEELLTEKNFAGSFTVVVMLKISKLNGWNTLLN